MRRFRTLANAPVTVLAIVLAMVLAFTMAGCRQAPSSTEHEKESSDERSIGDVWHKAKLRGVSFRAVGQEPGWLLEISDGQGILLVTNYGENTLEFGYTMPTVVQGEGHSEYLLDGGNTVITIYDKPCSDTMSGEAFQKTVTVDHRESRLSGCGRSLH